MSEHTFLVAVTVLSDDRAAAERLLETRLPTAGGRQVVEWWIAEDDRRDGSDCDSAVFVHKGEQSAAHDVLVHNGLAAQTY